MRLAAILSLVAGMAAAQEQSRAMPPVEEFVKSPAFHGIAYENAARYGPEDLDALRRILSDPAAAPYWAAAVWITGIIGTDAAAETLIAFHERGAEGEVSTAELSGLLLVPQALGFAARDPESPAFDYLARGLEAADRDLPWTAPGWEPETRAVLLAKLSANGLGLAGNEAGRELLRTTQRRLEEQDPKRLRFLRDNIAEALETSARIEELGYARALTPPPRPAGPRPPQDRPDSPDRPQTPDTDGDAPRPVE